MRTFSLVSVSALAGAAALAAVGFGIGGWQTTGSANMHTDAAVEAALTKACLSVVIGGRSRSELRTLQYDVQRPSGPEQSSTQRFEIAWSKMPGRFEPIALDSITSHDLHLYWQAIERCGDKFVTMDFVSPREGLHGEKIYD